MAVVFFFLWTIFVFGVGMLTHWMLTYKQRKLLKMYRKQARALRQWGSPIE